jgi:hypothetical protein
MLETEYERTFTTLSWWHMVLIFPLPLMLFLSLWISKIQVSYLKQRVPLLVPEGFHLFFIISAIIVWLKTGLWYYLAASTVALFPLTVYLSREKLLKRVDITL